MTEARVEHPGPGLVAKVVEAAHRDHRGGCAPESCGGSGLDPCRLANALEALYEALGAEALELGEPEPGHWHPATWGDTATIKGGARIRVGGQHEATVETVVVAHWVGSGSTQVQVKLEGRPQPYTMPPSGPVEVWVAALPEWASQAFLALAEGGLSNA